MRLLRATRGSGAPRPTELALSHNRAPPQSHPSYSALIWCAHHHQRQQCGRLAKGMSRLSFESELEGRRPSEHSISPPNLAAEFAPELGLACGRRREEVGGEDSSCWAADRAGLDYRCCWDWTGLDGCEGGVGAVRTGLSALGCVRAGTGVRMSAGKGARTYARAGAMRTFRFRIGFGSLSCV